MAYKGISLANKRSFAEHWNGVNQRNKLVYRDEDK